MVGDLFRIYGYAQSEHASFHWVTIPNDVSMDGDEVFLSSPTGRVVLGAAVIGQWAFGVLKSTATALVDATEDPALAQRVRESGEW